MGWILVIIAFALYLFGLADAIVLSFSAPHGRSVAWLPVPLDMMVSSLGAILLTNLGAVLGISITNKKITQKLN